MRSHFSNSIKRIVVKVGTQVISPDYNKISEYAIKNIVKAISDIRKKGVEVILVSSGAVGLGMKNLKLNSKPKNLSKLQAVAAVGQNKLMSLFQSHFSKYKIHVGQVLLTASDLHTAVGRRNVGHTLESLFTYKVVPIINENDSVAIDELKPFDYQQGKSLKAGVKFGDNDKLAAELTKLIDADALIILTDIDGFYSEDPKNNKNALLIPVITKITKDIEQKAGLAGSIVSVGGMHSKLGAAKLVTQAGKFVKIGNGFKDSLKDILEREDIGTLFKPNEIKLARKKAKSDAIKRRISKLNSSPRAPSIKSIKRGGLRG